MAGGFALIKDLLKTQVYQVAEYVNERADREVIPKFIIERPPTAELRPEQLDTDSLPPYEELDPVLEAYVEERTGGAGHHRPRLQSGTGAPSHQDSGCQRVQEAPGSVGVKITPRAFGRDWRMPISTRRRDGR